MIASIAKIANLETAQTYAAFFHAGNFGSLGNRGNSSICHGVARSGISNEPDSRRPNDKPLRASLLGGIGEVGLEDRSGYLRAPAFVALLDHLHLVFDAQLEFLQTHFLKLFVV